MTDIIMIPLTKLVESEHNVRPTKRKSGGIAELAQSIKHHGLLQSIVVRESASGKFAVIAGDAACALCVCSPNPATSRRAHLSPAA